jgi:exodeoxyribonuclease V beta subunit
MKALNLIDFPLDGLSLIEASAGTGKTYALANLYLRYLLERQFSVEEILVVTFTEAATQELKDRIRSRIQELGVVFDHYIAGGHQPGDEGSDAVLQYLYQQSKNPSADRLWLKLAERQIDQAEIHTIHGFCQQLLRRHALDSNVPIQQHLLENQNDLLQQVFEDFWRQQILTLEQEALYYIYANWSGPDDLLRSISPLLNRSPQNVIPKAGPEGIASWVSQFESSKSWFVTLKEQTLASLDEVEDILLSSGLKRLKDKLNWFNKIRAWSELPAIDFSFPNAGKRDNLFKEFVPANLCEQTKAKCSPPEHAYFAFLEQHLNELPAALEKQFIAHCYPLVRDMILKEKQSQRAFGFDDLILNVSDALKSADRSNAFAEAVRGRYQVALIDEFQDTDPAQYHIFSALFGPAAGENCGRLTLIGDPKQAIYAFRGGDIATYLKAKKDIAAHSNGHLFTMDTNWRSSPNMVSAVNSIFMGVGNPFRASDIPFQMVKAAKGSEHNYSHAEAVDNGQSVAALNIALLETEGLKKEQISSSLANYSVQKIVQLLAHDDDLKYSDIAILVRTGAEGELVKQRLAEVGLGASFEGKSSIFDSPEAQAIYFLLLAVADPKNEYAMRRCLAELFYGVSDQDFLQLNKQAQVFSNYLSVFEHLHKCWLSAGVLAMVRDALTALNVYEHWKSIAFNQGSNDWERSLTNINQIAELLQQQSRIYKGHFALIRWLRDNISGAGLGAGDESKLRLESDEQLIRIVTIHKSKGLEYPFVFVPFLFSARGADEAWFYNDEGALSIDLNKRDAYMELADEERLAEDIRLLYVALTRAKYQCYIGTAAYKSGAKASLGLAKTAWAYLIFKGEFPPKLDDEALTHVLAQWQQSHANLISVSQLTHEGLTDVAVSKRIQSSVSPGKLSARVLSRPIYDTWRVQSFTGLMNESHQKQSQAFNQPLVSAFSSLNSRSDRASSVNNIALNDGVNIFSFPRGSQAGTFLHTIFESIEFETTMLLPELREQYSSLDELLVTKLKLSKLVDEKLISQWSQYLQTWMVAVLNFPLHLSLTDQQSSAPVLSLNQLKKQHYFPEMNFYFSVDKLRASRFNVLLARYGYGAHQMEFNTFEGHLKGAIDLVFKANEQYFILDYKSNFLGESIEDYQLDALQQVMDEHRYDVQYLIYTLAIHRFLKHRLGAAYCYERDYGGVYYLFLRGLDFDKPASGTGVLFVKPERALIESLDEEVSPS